MKTVYPYYKRKISMTFFSKTQEFLERLGGYRSVPPSLSWEVGMGLWWALLLALTIAFAGVGTKFVYIDF